MRTTLEKFMEIIRNRGNEDEIIGDLVDYGRVAWTIQVLISDAIQNWFREIIVELIHKGYDVDEIKTKTYMAFMNDQGAIDVEEFDAVKFEEFEQEYDDWFDECEAIDREDAREIDRLRFQ